MSQNGGLTLEDLTTEVLVHILKFLDPIWDIAKVSMVCRRLHSICQNPVFKSKIRHVTRDQAQKSTREPGLSILASRIDPETPELSITAVERFPLTLLDRIFKASRMLTKLTLTDCHMHQDMWKYLPESLEELHMFDTWYYGRYDNMFTRNRKLTNLKLIHKEVTSLHPKLLTIMASNIVGLRKRFHFEVFDEEKKVFSRSLDVWVATFQYVSEFEKAFNEVMDRARGHMWTHSGRIERLSEDEFKVVLRINMPYNPKRIRHESSNCC